MSETDGTSGPVDLQFQHAEALPQEGAPGSQLCVACRRPTGNTYFHAQGQAVCPLCAERIQSGQQAPPASSLGRAVLYGLGAAVAGCILYALVAIITGWQIGWVALIVGTLVGKAIRHASNGMGGRPQQILAVILTYFAISTSFVPVVLYEAAKHPERFARPAQTEEARQAAQTEARERPVRTVVGALVSLLLLGLAAPFFDVASVSGLITLFLIFIGMQRAWKLTARPEILIMGPYESAPAQ